MFRIVTQRFSLIVLLAFVLMVLLGFSNASAQQAYTVTDLGTLGGTTSFARAINNFDQVVGWADTTGGRHHAFIYSEGVLRDLNGLIPAESGWEMREAYGINDAGQIVGDGLINGQMHAFLLTPVTSAPEDGD